MRHQLLFNARLLFAIVALMTSLTSEPMVALGGEIQFVEDFVLARDRSAAISQLIPGTDTYYFYQSIHLQNTQQYDQVEKLLKQWQQRHGETQSYREIRHRQMLLTYSTNPKRSIDYLIGELGPNLAHQQEQLESKPKLPSKLDPKVIDYERLKKAAFRRNRGLKEFTNRALHLLSADELDATRRREYLTRIASPSHPALVEMILADLKHKGSRGFGSLRIHRQLLLTQLDELAARRPQLENESKFVTTYIQKLHPNPDVDWRNDPAAHAEYLSRLWGFVRNLNASHNSVKAHVLYNWLALEEKQGVFNKRRFLEYLALPRHSSYVQPRLLEAAEARRHPVDLDWNPGNITQCRPISNDEQLVRRFLLHFFKSENSYAKYEPFIKDDYLRHIFAEAKITNGIGDPEKWYSLLPPARYQLLKDRVDIDFAATNPKSFGSADAIELDVEIKNVEKLIVKVYEVNTKNYYQRYGREVNTDIKLDGLIANDEVTHEFSEAPVIRKRRRFTFPSLRAPGVYVIDFIGNGKSSRAVIRKGELRYLVRTTAAGHIFTVFDDQDEQVKDASIWMSGQYFTSREDGTDDGSIVVPYSTAPGRQPIVFTHGNLSSLHHFQHEGEDYELNVAAFVDRESLLDRQEAMLLLRPEVRLSGITVSPSVLEDIRVTIRSTTLDGVHAERVIEDVKLLAERDTPLLFMVPSRLNKVQVSVTAKITDAKRKTRTYEASHQLSINQIDSTEKIEHLHLSKLGDHYIVQLLGKTGEARAYRPVRLELTHDMFTRPIRVNLATDENGVIHLGSLGNITAIKATGPNTATETWQLWRDRRTASRSVHALEGESIQVPHMFGKGGLDKSGVKLFEIRGGTLAIDASKAAQVGDHFITFNKLKAGDYRLLVNDRSTRIRVTKGTREQNFAYGGYRSLEQRKLRPLQLTRVSSDGKNLNIQLVNASKFTRVHVYATRFFPAFDSYSAFSAIREVEPMLMRSPVQLSHYMAGRKLGEELQYVLERGYATKYPGNMLERPTLLLNSWPIRSTETTTQTAASGEDFEASADAPESAMQRAEQQQRADDGLTDFASLDFLAEPSMSIVNRTPDHDGRISIPLDELGAHHHFQVVAVDPLTTVYRSIALPEINTRQRDLRLVVGLDPKKHYTQQKKISQLAAGETFEMADITTGRFDTYDSMRSAFSLYATLSNNTVLNQFKFIVDWPNLSSEEKHEKYSEFACHELNFFLYKKDEAFFREVIRPYIANKQHKTFMDLWLLDADVTSFLKPWEYKQLNTAERLLLGERIDGEDVYARRLIEDLFDLKPNDIGRWNVEFESAILGKSLNKGASYGFALKQRELADSFAVVPNAAPASGFGGGGYGGRTDARGLRLQLNGSSSPPDSSVVAEKLKSNERVRAESLSKRKSRSRALGRDVQDFASLADTDEDGSESLFEVRRAGRGRRRLYEKLEKTQEWAENNYYRLPIAEQTENLIQVNAFWHDYATRDKQRPFFSHNWPTARNNFSEMLFALSLLDLPFQGGEHTSKFQDGKMTLTAASPLILFQEQIREADVAKQESPILITQNFFRANDRYQMVQGERRDKFVTDEFLTHTVYGCQVVLTNPTSSPRKVQLLVQIPYASLPTNGCKATRTIDFDLAPYHTQTVDYFFYFPQAGDFPHYPAHVAQDEVVLAHASPTSLNVVEKPTKINKQSWDYVSQFADDAEVLDYLREHNVFEVDLKRIAHRMRDQEFFQATTKLLRSRHAYEAELWAYGLKHNDAEGVATWLKHKDGFLGSCGLSLESDLIDIDPVLRRTYQHLDYRPLVNARAHRLGGRRRILNNRFDQQYHRLLNVLKYKAELNDEDRIALTYYLLLQDRIEEAIEMFTTVQKSSLDTQLQYDYFAAYLDCFSDNPQRARSIVTRYVSHPVPKWRKAFAHVKAMLDELDGEDAQLVEEKDRTQAMAAAAAAQTSFDFSVRDKEVLVNYQNVDRIRVNYYLIDLELLFSSKPFVQQLSGSAGQFSHIRPNTSKELALPGDNSQHSFQLPEAYHNRNLMIEIVADGITRSQAYFSNSLTVQVSENYGQLRVSDTESGKSLPKTYVKCYAEMKDGRTLFYKDGYTDLRGRFDYSSLSTNELDFVKRFSLLILDDDRGGLVREVQVPKR